MGGGWGSNCPTPYSWLKPDENAICPGQSWPEYPKNALGTDVRRITRHDGAKNRAGRVPGTRTGPADLDYEGNVYTEKREMWETLSPDSQVQISLIQFSYSHV